MADIEIEIDGKKLTAQPNQTVIQVADEAGIYIPRFCYHKHLSIPANCRMCLVEVEKAPKALPACATPVAPGMKVFTKSQKTMLAQRAVMEFLLINHPLDCPICDQGGECELQDLAMGYGSSFSHYDESKRAVEDENLGPLIATEMTRCILCTRCIRFGDEIAGMRELGMTYRGEHEEVSTYVEKSIQSEVSGNIIDLCPVGALTSKPYRFTARPWELDQASSVSPHDCVGANLHVHTRYGKVMRVVARENGAVNQTWIADRDRFSYVGLAHPERLEEPMIKINGQWQVVDWQQAFEFAATKLQAVIAEHGADKIGALASPHSTVEEFYLLQKIVRGLGSTHIDHRLRECDTQDQASLALFPALNSSLAELEQCQTIMLIGSNLQKEQPLIALRVRQAALKGAAVLAVNPVDYAFNFNVNHQHIVAPQYMVQALAAILKVLNPQAASIFADVSVTEEAKFIAQRLQSQTKTHIILGALALHHPQASLIRYLANHIAAHAQATVGFLTSGGNSAGGWIAGAIPHRHAGGAATQPTGLSAYEMLHKPRKAYVLLNVEPELDCANAHLAIEACKQAQTMIAISQFNHPSLQKYAEVILPMAAFTESAGTYVNAMGEWQTVKGVATPFGAARPAWKILRVLGNFLQLEGFDYESAEAIKHEVQATVEKNQCVSSVFTPAPPVAPFNLTRVGEVPIYASDSLVRHSQPLQMVQNAVMGNEMSMVRIHPETAAKFSLQENDKVKVQQQKSYAELFVQLDERIALHTAYIAAGIPETAELGDLFGEVQLEKCESK
jgi:NADH-quinone oxidoreductase subunit G